MDTDDAIRAILCFVTFLCGVYAGAGMGAIGEYERALERKATEDYYRGFGELDTQGGQV